MVPTSKARTRHGRRVPWYLERVDILVHGPGSRMKKERKAQLDSLYLGAYFTDYAVQCRESGIPFMLSFNYTILLIWWPSDSNPSAAPFWFNVAHSEEWISGCEKDCVIHCWKQASVELGSKYDRTSWKQPRILVRPTLFEVRLGVAPKNVD